MSLVADPTPVEAAAICPVCPPFDQGALSEKAAPLVLSVPTAHCATCISGIESVLTAQAGVRGARVNLSLKRVSVEAGPGAPSPESLAVIVTAAGWPAQALDAGLLAPAEVEREARALLMRLGVAGFAMMNLMLLSVAVWSGAADVTRNFFHLVSAVIALPTVAFAAQPFFRNAARALAARRLNMDVPISLAILLATGMSLFETFAGGASAYFDAAVSLTFFLLAGRYLEAKTRSTSRSAAVSLSALAVPKAMLADGPLVDAKDLTPGQMIRVLPGLRFPADGVVVRGTSEVDRSMLTGESEPIAVVPGALCDAGILNLSGALDVRVLRAGADTAISRLSGLIEVAEAARNRYSGLADRAARIYAPGVHILALLAFAGWLAVGADLRHAINIAIAVLIITCPCALGLAVPAVVTAATGRMFRRGLLLKSPTALERLAEVDHVVFDKTGTLTLERPDVLALPDRGREIMLALASASAHPLSQSLAMRLRAEGVQAAEVEDLREVPGKGVEGRFEGQIVRMGRASWLGALGAETSEVCFRQGAGELVRVPFGEAARPDAAELVAALARLGVTAEILSGDRPERVAAFAATLGITEVRAGLAPEDKLARLVALKGEGRRVLMVGDGLNDTAALAAAHVSAAPGSALDAAQSLADVVLTAPSLLAVPRAIRTARRARRLILQNFAVAAIYNSVSIPLAVMGYATPLAASVAMSTSSIVVSLNALRVK
jgi:P-type Cu2+ transporter